MAEAPAGGKGSVSRVRRVIIGRAGHIASGTRRHPLPPNEVRTHVIRTRRAAPADWRRLHALGLPSGSVRALLAVLVFAAVWGLLLFDPSREVPDYLGDLLFIIMGHYFAVRGRSSQEPDPGPPPLFLPSGSVRLVLVAGCAAVAVMLYLRGQLTRLDRNPGAVTLILVGGFLLGVGLNAVAVWWHERGPPALAGRRGRPGCVSVAAAVALIALVWNRLFPVVPAPGSTPPSRGSTSAGSAPSTSSRRSSGSTSGRAPDGPRPAARRWTRPGPPRRRRPMGSGRTAGR